MIIKEINLICDLCGKKGKDKRKFKDEETYKDILAQNRDHIINRPYLILCPKCKKKEKQEKNK